MSIAKLIPHKIAAGAVACRLAAGECYRIANAAAFPLLGGLFRLAVVVYFIFCALVLGLRYVVLPNIDSYKPDVERLASRALGNRVSIGDIRASWSGLHPRLALDKVVIHDKSGQAALTLPSVSATLSWLTAVTGELRLQQLEISRPDMDVRRDAEGRLYVAGILIDMGKGGDGKGADWVLSQHQILIRDGRLRWNDEMRAAPELVLDKVDIALYNQWRDHRFALRATPPAGHAAPLDVRAAFEHPHFAGRISDATRWKGELYADLRDTDLTVWRAYFDYPIDLQRGMGSVRAWLSFDRARVADFTADLTLSNVSAQLRAELEPLNLTEVSGRVSVREEFGKADMDDASAFGEHGHAIAFTDFTLQTDDGLFLPRTTISESHTPARGGRPAKTEIRARLLDLETLASFTERLPVPAEQRRMLEDFAPRGVLKDFSAQWHGVYPAISSYSVKGSFAGLSLKPQPARPARPKTAAGPAQAAVPAIPGFRNLTGRVEANDRGGSFQLASGNVLLQLPGYFKESDLPFEKLNMQAGWAFQEQDRLLLDIQTMDFVHEDIAGSFAGKHLMPISKQDGRPGTIDVHGKLSRVDVAKVERYLPLQTPPELRDWLTGALLGGTVKDVRLKLKGELSQFPFHAQQDRAKGEFSIAGKIENGKLNYAPGLYARDGKSPMWPVIDQINGTISFDRARMDIHADSARSAGTSLSRVKVWIPDLAAGQSVLMVDGEAAGPLQNFIRFTNDSPVAEWIGHFTEETKGSGNARLALKLALPLDRMEDAKVQGSLQFAGNTVTLRNLLPPVSAASGKLEFHEKGFALPGIKGSFLGGPVTISGGTQRDGTTLVKADGTLTADGVRRTYATAATQRLAERISGSTRYSTTIRVRNGQPEIGIESSLAGIALDFPAPLRKAASDSLPLKFELTGLSGGDAALLRDEMKISLGNAISARYERQRSNDKESDWIVTRGGIGVNVPAPLPDSGLSANVSLRSLDIDAWRRALGPVVEQPRGAEARPQQDALSLAQYIEPEVLAARATELVVMDRRLDNVVVGASHQKGSWQANIDSEQASGYVTWMDSPSGRGLGRVTARLASLVIPKSAAPAVSELLEGKSATTQMPAVDIVAENFELFGKKFGQLELAAQNGRGFSGREWRINKLSIVNADAELRGSGKWTARDGENISSLNYTLNITDAGRLLDRFGFSNVLRGGKGKMEGEVSWKGLPFELDIPTLNGELTLNLAGGQFLKVDPAAAKLLGVLSLQSLPRRLALDFRDVFSEGFAFDGVTATASIANGVARTDNFKMRGVAATVLIDGTADIAKEAQDLHVVVIPEINVGAASVVYGLAVNPVIGVGTFLAQLFLRDPLMKAFTFEYAVTGPWTDPVVNKLVRKPQTPTGDVVNQSGNNG